MLSDLRNLPLICEWCNAPSKNAVVIGGKWICPHCEQVALEDFNKAKRENEEEDSSWG